MPKGRGPIHLVVPHRPGADHGQLRARLEGLAPLQSNAVQWHVPAQRAGIVQAAEEAALAAQADGGLVVAAGGDGTINAVATAAWKHQVRMGVIPVGTFNYFAREQSLSLDPEQAANDILAAMDSGDARPVSVGFVNDRMFLVNASVGLYPRLLEERELASRRFGRSRWVAIVSAVWSFFRPASARRWRVALRQHRVADPTREEFFASTLFVGNNPCNWNAWAFRRPRTWPTATAWRCCCSSPRAALPPRAPCGMPPWANWRATRPSSAWPAPRWSWSPLGGRTA